MESLCSKPLQQPAAPTRAGVGDAAPFLPSGKQRLTAQGPAQNHTGPSPGQAATDLATAMWTKAATPHPQLL